LVPFSFFGRLHKLFYSLFRFLADAFDWTTKHFRSLSITFDSAIKHFRLLTDAFG
jgi:hypothetical protein